MSPCPSLFFGVSSLCVADMHGLPMINWRKRGRGMEPNKTTGKKARPSSYIIILHLSPCICVSHRADGLGKSLEVIWHLRIYVHDSFISGTIGHHKYVPVIRVCGWDLAECLEHWSINYVDTKTKYRFELTSPRSTWYEPHSNELRAPAK